MINPSPPSTKKKKYMLILTSVVISHIILKNRKPTNQIECQLFSQKINILSNSIYICIMEEEKLLQPNEPTHPKQIGLHINSSSHSLKNNVTQDDRQQTNTIELEAMEEQKYNKIPQTQPIYYSLNDSNTDTTPTSYPQQNNTNSLRLYYKYRIEYLMDHRRQRNYLVFIPMLILFIIFIIFALTSLIKRMDRNTITSDLNSLNQIYECSRWDSSYYDNIIAWYDANNGFNSSTNILFDLSNNKNHINLTNTNIQIKTENINNTNQFKYLFGSTNDVIDIPINISNYQSFAIYYMARYNGVNRGSILTDVSTEFYCGFNNGSAGVCYWNGQRLSQCYSDIYGNEWVLSAMHRYIGKTSINDVNIWYCTQNCQTSFYTDYDSSESKPLSLNHLNINGQYNSDWALTEIIITRIDLDTFLFDTSLGTMCIEDYFSNKYKINSYHYSIGSVILLQIFNWPIIVVIIAAGIVANVLLFYGFFYKMTIESFGQLILQFCGYLCTWWCCKWNINCCGGLFRGSFLRHVCSCQISVFPLYNIFSTFAVIVSIINRIIFSRTEIILYLLLNGLCVLFATIIHFIFTFEYIIGKSVTHTTLNEYYPFFYLIEFELCIFLWCSAIMDGLRNYPHNLYWIIILFLYAYLSFSIFVFLQIVFHKWLVDEALLILGISLSIIVFLSLYIGYVIKNYVYFISHLIRCVFLILLIVALVTQWNGVYKVWIFSILLIHFISLYVGDFMLSNTAIYAISSKNGMFQAMVNTNTIY
eukprot:485700_1